MSFLKRFFGKSGDAEPDIDAQLAALEAQAADARPGYVGSAFNKAGDLALKGGRREKAVGYYGQAIDAFLEDAQREQARSVANKIIRVRPSAVRTLCTLTWLDLSARHPAMALLHLRDYVEAAKDASQQPRAATQIYLMARTSPDSEFLGAVADGLDLLDFPKRAAEVRSWVTAGAPDAIPDDDERSQVCLEAAVHSNDSDIELIEDEPDGVPDGDDGGAPVEATEGEEEVADDPADDLEGDSDEAEDDPASDDDSAQAEDDAAASNDSAEVESDPVTDDDPAEVESDPATDDDPGDGTEAQNNVPEPPAATEDDAVESKKGRSRKSRKKRKKKKKR